MIKLIGTVLFLCISVVAYSQLTGVVKDTLTNEGIPFSKVYFVNLQIGVVSDASGKFEFTEPLPNQFTIRVNASGYESKEVLIQGSENQIIYLTESHVEFEEVVVSTLKGGLQTKNPTFVWSRNTAELNEIATTSIGELLGKIPGVSTASSGNGVSKPVVRGLKGNRVVTMLNGIRLENQQWGADHDVGLTDLGIGKIEVIKGPSSLLFGSDALGGVGYFVDEEYEQVGQSSLKLESQYESNGNGTKTNIGYKIGGKSVRFNFFGSYNDYADYQLPSGDYVNNSSFNGGTIKMALGANKKNWATHLRYTMSTSRVGIIGETEDSLPTILSYTSDSQDRYSDIPLQGYQNHIVSWENKFFGNQKEWTIRLGHTYSQLEEFEEAYNEAAMGIGLHNTTYNVLLKTKINPYLELVTGMQGSFQFTSNFGEEEELIPDASQYDNGLLLIGYSHYKKWDFQAGGRFDYRALSANEDPTVSQMFLKEYSSANFGIGAVRNGKNNSFRVNVSSGYRMPHLSELLVDGEHHGALRYEIGNKELKSERAYQLDLSQELRGEHIHVVINPFVNIMTNFIYLEAQDSVIDDLPVYKYNQLNEVLMTGVDLSFHYHPHFAHWLHWESSYSYLYAADNQGVAVPFMPQNKLSTSIKFNFEMQSKFIIENIVINHSYFFDQNRIGQFETSTIGYNIVDLGINTKLNTKLPMRFSAGVKNLLNETYINHLSGLKGIGVSSPGRNVYVKVTISVEKKKNK